MQIDCSSAHTADYRAGRRLVPVKTAFAEIGVGTTKGYALISDGDLEAVKIGARTYIVAASIDRFVAKLPRVGQEAA